MRFEISQLNGQLIWKLKVVSVLPYFIVLGSLC